MIYPVIGIGEYGWNFAGSDVNKSSIEWAEDKIIRKNIYIKEHMIDRGGTIRL